MLSSWLAIYKSALCPTSVYKISNNDIYDIGKEMLMTITTEMLIKDEVMNKSISGITVSPKKNFCILKIWMKKTHQLKL